jgi:serine/arginine repetitive matrix protein 2
MLRKGTLRSGPEEKQPEAPPTPMATPSEAPEKKKRGFMGSFLRRNRSSNASIPQMSKSDVPAVPPLPTPQSPLATASVGPVSPSSPSNRKLVRRGSYQPKPALQRGDSSFSNATAPVTSTPRKDSDNWPLPPPLPVTGAATSSDDRPNTSDGISSEAIKLAHTMRPDLAPRSQSGMPLGQRSVRIQAGEEGQEPGEREKDRVAYSKRTGKKKKFGTLRRALGIND